MIGLPTKIHSKTSFQWGVCFESGKMWWWKVSLSINQSMFCIIVIRLTVKQTEATVGDLLQSSTETHKNFESTFIRMMFVVQQVVARQGCSSPLSPTCVSGSFFIWSFLQNISSAFFVCMKLTINYQENAPKHKARSAPATTHLPPSVSPPRVTIKPKL